MLPPAFPPGPGDTATGSDRPVPEREKGRGGRSPGASGSARLPAGGWAVGRPPVRRPRQRATSSSIALPGAPDLLPVVASSSRLLWPAAPEARSLRSETRGRRTSRCGYRRVPGASRGGSAGRAGSASRVCASREGPRAALEGQSAVGRGENVVQRSRSAAKVHRRGKPRRPGGPRGMRELGRPSGGRRSPGEEGDRDRRARAVRRTASSGRLPWSRVVRSGAGGARIGARGRPSRERAPERRARGPCPSRRWGRSPDRTGHRVTPRPDESVPGR
jgi:hypothetical protein